MGRPRTPVIAAAQKAIVQGSGKLTIPLRPKRTAAAIESKTKSRGRDGTTRVSWHKPGPPTSRIRRPQVGCVGLPIIWQKIQLIEDAGGEQGIGEALRTLWLSFNMKENDPAFTARGTGNTISHAIQHQEIPEKTPIQSVTCITYLFSQKWLIKTLSRTRKEPPPSTQKPCTGAPTLVGDRCLTQRTGYNTTTHHPQLEPLSRAYRQNNEIQRVHKSGVIEQAISPSGDNAQN